MRSKRSDQLNEAILLCKIHRERMLFAWSKLLGIFPLSVEKYNALQPENLSFLDQLIFRFSKLQDSMGNKLFPSLLQSLGEETRSTPFIDLLTKMEELELLEDANDWLVLRETRNIVTHEYPFMPQDVVDGLNLLSTHQKLILTILQKLFDKIDARFS